MKLRQSVFSHALLLGSCCFGSSYLAADVEVGNEDQPWVMAGEALEETTEIFLSTPEEYAAEAAQGVTARGPLEDAGQLLIGSQQVFVSAMERMVEVLPVASTGCDRSDLMAANAMLMLGSFGLAPALTVAGGGAGFAVGAVAGGILASPSVLGAFPGAGSMGTAGAVAGGGLGAAAGATQVALVGLYVAKNVQEVVDRTEPCSGGGVQQRSGTPEPDVGVPTLSAEDPQFWVDFAEPEDADDAEEAGVTERAARPMGSATAKVARPTSRAQTTGSRRTPTNRYANQYESLFVQMVRQLYGNAIYDLAQNWENSRVVPAQARGFLRTPLARQHFKPAVQLLAYIKRYGRLPDGLPARPLTASQQFVTDWLNGDTTAMRDAWLRAMGMGHTRLRVASNRLTWTTPPALRTVGLAPTISRNLSPGSLSAMGLVRATVSPGPLDLVFGRPSIAGNRVKVDYSIENRSSLGAVRLQHKTFTGGWQTFFNTHPRTSGTVRGSVFYRFNSAGPMIDSVSFGNVRLSMPQFPVPNVPGIAGAVNEIRNNVEATARRFAGQALPIAAVFDQAANSAKQNLLRTLKQQAAELGFSNIDRIVSIAISNGKLRIRIGGYKTELALPPLPTNAQLRPLLTRYEAELRNAGQRRSRPRR